MTFLPLLFLARPGTETLTPPPRIRLAGGRLRRILHDEVAFRTLHIILIWVVVNHGMFSAEIVPGMWRRNTPLECRSAPRVFRSWRTLITAVDQIEDEDELRGAGAECRDGNEFVQRQQRSGVIIYERRITPHVAHQSEVMERPENAMGTDKGEPEMKLAQGWVHHAAGHLAEPEVRAGKDTEKGRHTHDHVEMADNEIGGVQDDVNGWLRQEKAANAAADEHGDESERKERCCVDANVRAVQAAQPYQCHDRRRNRDRERGKGEQQRRKRIHATHKHVVSPNHPAQEADGHHRVDDNASAQERLAHAVDQNVRNDAHRGQYRNVNLGMAEEPEQVLPEKGGSPGVRLQAITYHQAGRDEEAGPGSAVKKQKYASRKEHGESQQSDTGGDEPRPGANRHAHQSHALGAQIERCSDKVEGSKQGPDAENGDRNRREVHPPAHPRASILADCTQRSIRGPAGNRWSVRNDEGKDQHQEGDERRPE